MRKKYRKDAKKRLDMDGHKAADVLLPRTAKVYVKAAHRYEVVESRVHLKDLERIGLNLAGKRFHFIGAGGVGMSGLAQLLIKNKAIVTGSDQTESAVTSKLCDLGADIKIGHDVNNLAKRDAVVISAAIKQDNPELQLARQKGCKIYKYAQMLGELMNSYEGIAIAGTHGKSTTSGWLSYILKKAGIDASFIVGANVTQLGGSSGVGDSRYFIAEACEYDRSFLNLRPKIACILNIEQDHLDYYKDVGEIIDAFCEFVLRVKSEGLLIVNGQDTNAAKAILDSGNFIYYETFGFDSRCNFYPQNIRLTNGLYSFDVYHNSRFLGKTRISLPGKHNILNALAVIAMTVNVGLPHQQILRLLPEFTGIDRRIMLKGQFVVRNKSGVLQSERNIRYTQYAIRGTKITVLDDYAHHPTEIKAALQAIRERYEPRRIWCVFQPHQYSRTRFLLEDFAESFKLADVTIVPEIYFVRDSASGKKEINSEILVERIRAKGSEALFIDSFETICDYLQKNVEAGDLVVTMGAGDIWKVADEYIQRLRANS
jgi:UDP-N-acetylmuramate--alanine ligase